MQRRLNLHFRRHAAEFGEVEWYSPSGCGEGGDPYDTIWRDIGGEDEMPGVISDGGSSDFLRPEAHRRWIATGVYGPINKEGLVFRPEFEAAGIADPLGAMHPYAAFPTVLLVDKIRLAGRPCPRGWEDLLDPAFRGDIIISGHDDEIPDLLLFNYAKAFGRDGVAAFGANVKDFWPQAKMAKSAGSGNPEGAAVYVLNRFFALGNRHSQAAEIVWPIEGAWFNPLMVLAKRRRREAADLPISFLLGAEWAGFLESVGLPAAHVFPGQKPLPGPLAWTGWEFFRSQDVVALREELLRVAAR